MVTTTVSKPAYITVEAPTVKYSNSFMAFGWLKDPIFAAGDMLIPMAVANPDGEVLDVEDSIYLELVKDGRDFRLRYKGSRSKRIRQTVKVAINDEAWHFFGYQCDEQGYMKYYVDGLYLPAEEGLDSNGVSYGRARSYSVRAGGGDVWSPYLYKAGQGTSVYHWRMRTSQNIPDGWVLELMQADLPTLPA